MGKEVHLQTSAPISTDDSSEGLLSSCLSWMSGSSDWPDAFVPMLVALIRLAALRQAFRTPSAEQQANCSGVDPALVCA